ncbi:MAG: hypothetical protein L0K86_28995, partial [Actinomycetia bacterium]|nr:hypothetical protein [Actinomycetes bacterium]
MVSPDLLVVALAAGSDRQIGRALVVLPRVIAERDELVESVRTALDVRLPELVDRAHHDAPLRDGLAAAVALLRPEAGAVAAVDRLPRLTAGTARLVGQVLLTAGP